MKELIKDWEEEYKRLEDVKQTDVEHLQFIKINAKALQLKYCINALKKQLAIDSVIMPKGTFACHEQLKGNKKCDRQCSRIDCHYLNQEAR